MVTALGQADSFNSSGATIVPDRNENGSRYPVRSRLSGDGNRTDIVDGPSNFSLKGAQTLVEQSRMLMPQDTFGRELDALINGGSGDDGIGNSQHWSMPPGLNQGEPTSSGSQPIREFTGSQFLNIPSPPAAEAVELSVINAHFLPTSDSHFMPDPHAQYNNSRDDFRPSSAQSHSASEYSWSSTDVDNDSNMSDTGSLFRGQNDQLQGINLDGMTMGAGPSNHYWQPHTQLNGQTNHNVGSVKTEAPSNELHTIAPDSVSPADMRSSVGPIRGNSEEQTAKLQRLEHRRSINRKSAQKHRRMRKEEVAELSQQVAVRDHKIAELERKLAVEKAKVEQLEGFVRESRLSFGNQAPAW